MAFCKLYFWNDLLKVPCFASFLRLILSISDDLHDTRANLTELTRRLHELELELRRLENEREELTAAYKEAEAVSVGF